MNTPIHSRGFTLVEVLFALFILAVGILGIIGLQLFAKQNNYDAIQRTSAAALATDIVERMRINNTALPSYRSRVEPIGADAVMPDPDPCVTVVASGATGCPPATIATRDLAIWHAMINGVNEANADGTPSGGLVAPSACIKFDPNGTGSENAYRIVIAWRGRSALSDPVADDCGANIASKPYGANNEYRRLFVMDVYIQTAK